MYWVLGKGVTEKGDLVWSKMTCSLERLSWGSGIELRCEGWVGISSLKVCGMWDTAYLKKRTVDAKASGWEEAGCVLGMERKPWSGWPGTKRARDKAGEDTRARSFKILSRECHWGFRAEEITLVSVWRTNCRVQQWMQKDSSVVKGLMWQGTEGVQVQAGISQAWTGRNILGGDKSVGRAVRQTCFQIHTPTFVSHVPQPRCLTSLSLSSSFMKCWWQWQNTQ